MPIILRKTITETFLERVKTNPLSEVFRFKSRKGDSNKWESIHFKEFYQECKLTSFGLKGVGLQTGDRVVLNSNTRLEWSLCDMAILGAKGITIPIYSSSTLEDVHYISHHSEARILIVEGAEQLQKILQKRLEDPAAFCSLLKIIVIENSAMALVGQNLKIAHDVMTLQALKEIGRREEAKNPSWFDENLREAKPDDLLTICYTSGTTGVPKGVMITHENMMSVLEDCAALFSRFMNSEQEVLLSFLPFSHIFGKVESMAIYAFGWTQAFAESWEKVYDNFKEIQPTLVFAVPWIFEKIKKRIEEKLVQESGVKKLVLNKAIEASRQYYQLIRSQKKPSLVQSAEYQMAKVFYLNRMIDEFGGRIRFAICGGAPLIAEIGEFFQMIGILILEGYGLTETCAPVAINVPDQYKFGAVGKPLPEVMVKIAEDGEILIKSKKVCKGYYKMPEETEQMFQGGWFHTGDVGHIDSEGFLHITDRKKDMIVTSNGKNIAPQKIENLAQSQKLIHQFFVHGDQRHYLTALVTLHKNQVIEYANEHQILFSEYAELIKNPKILSLTQRMIDHMNKKLASYEMIKKFVILPDDFTVNKGELTPSMKVRRKFLNQKYKIELDSMYGDSVRVPLDSSA